jgi:hypothetical protein
MIGISKVFAQNPVDIVGTVTNPLSYGGVTGGLTVFLTNILRVVFVVAGIVAFINFLLSGFKYMTAAGDSKKLQEAWDRIWQSLIGLILIMGSFALVTVFSYLVFGNAEFILNPQIYGPK